MFEETCESTDDVIKYVQKRHPKAYPNPAFRDLLKKFFSKWYLSVLKIKTIRLMNQVFF